MALSSRPGIAVERSLYTAGVEAAEVRALLRERDQLRTDSVSVSDTSVENMEKEALIRENQIDKTEQKIEKMAPGLLELMLPEPYSVEKLQKNLKQDEGLLVFLEDEKSSFGWLITTECFTWYEMQGMGREEAQSLSNAIRAAITPQIGIRGRQVANVGSSINSMENLLEQAYQRVLTPIIGALANVRRLMVHGNGTFLALPFAALINPDNGQYEVERRSYALLPSLRALAIDAGEQRVANELSILAIGAPELTTNSKFSVLQDLPGAKRELKAIDKNFGGRAKILRSGDATKEQLVRQLIDSEDEVLLFATHAIFADEKGDFPTTGLLLTPSPSDPEDDGLLTLHEIAGLPLNGELVILSACNSWSGENGANDEALTGLSLAFFRAGSQNLIVTHWPISDSSAALWSQVLLRHLVASPDDLDGAVRSAQLQLRRVDGGRWSHPKHWAAFLPVRGGRTLDSVKPSKESGSGPNQAAFLTSGGVGK